MDNQIVEIVKKQLPVHYKLIYLTKTGSHLFGTNTQLSDVDYKGIYIPSLVDLITEKTIHRSEVNSSDHKQKNTKDDIDCELMSIHKFFSYLEKGETNAIELLFSMFREDTIIYYDTIVIFQIRENYKKFLNYNTSAFIGYCYQQAHQYGLKNDKLDTLITLSNHFNDDFKIIKDFINSINLSTFDQSYIYQSDGFIYLLNKKYDINSPYQNFKKIVLNHIKHYNVPTQLQNINYKAISHAVRTIAEIQELLENGFIKFPLKKSQYILSIKLGKIQVEAAIQDLGKSIEEVKKLTKTLKIQKECDKKFMAELLYKLCITNS